MTDPDPEDDIVCDVCKGPPRFMAWSDAATVLRFGFLCAACVDSDAAGAKFVGPINLEPLPKDREPE